MTALFAIALALALGLAVHRYMTPCNRRPL